MKVKVYKCHPDAIIPERKSDEAAGYDLHTIEDFFLEPGSRVIVRTGLVVQPPPGYHTEVFARSGNAFKYAVGLTNNIGLVDRDFAGEKDELLVMLSMPTLDLIKDGDFHYQPDTLEFKKGDRVAQLVFRKTEFFDLEEVDAAPGAVDRGGFGSTGKR